MSRFGLVGPTYTAQSPKFANELAKNLYCEPIESPNPGKGGSKMMLVKIPGLQTIHALTDAPLRCLFTADGERAFAVSGSTLFELFGDGTFSALGNVKAASSPAQIFANGTQLFILSGGQAYIYDGVSIVEVCDTPLCLGGYLDGYFLGVEGAAPGESLTFRISANGDGKTWDDLDFAAVNQSPDNIQSLLVIERQALFLKKQKSEFFWDSGDPNFPIQPVQGSLIEQGSGAAFSAVRIDNTSMWLGGDERGAGIVWRMQGYTPMRVSNFAIENAIQGYVRAGNIITDAVAFAMQINGHTFYVLSFPSADATWVYDCATSLWHEWAAWDQVNALWHQHPARFHCYAQDRHYVGGGDGTGNVYNMSTANQDMAGQPLRWLRRAPHIADPGSKMIFFSNLFIDFQVGVGINSLVGQDGKPRQPVVMVRHSNDGGYTWGAEQHLAIGKLGEYSIRARQLMCGSGRDRNIEVSGTDPVEIAMVEADIQAEVGIS